MIKIYSMEKNLNKNINMISTIHSPCPLINTHEHIHVAHMPFMQLKTHAHIQHIHIYTQTIHTYKHIYKSKHDTYNP